MIQIRTVSQCTKEVTGRLIDVKVAEPAEYFTSQGVQPFDERNKKVAGYNFTMKEAGLDVGILECKKVAVEMQLVVLEMNTCQMR